MSSKNSSTSFIAVIGIIVIALTVAAFFLLDIERIEIFLWAFGFLLLSEIILFAGLIGLRRSIAQSGNVFMKSGVTSALILYFIATLIMALFSDTLRENLYVFVFIELCIFALFAVVTIAILAFSRSIARRNEADMSKVGDNEPKRGGF